MDPFPMTHVASSVENMAERISDADFARAPGVDDWRPLFWGAKTLYKTGDFATGVRLVNAIADEAAELRHDPIVDLRSDSVTVQVITVGVGLSDLDLTLAQAISRAAARLDLTADPSAVQQVQLAFDASDQPAVLDFWRAALGYVAVTPTDLVAPNLHDPSAWFQEKDYRAPRNRIHIDVSLPPDQAQARVDAILPAGGTMLGDKYAPAWWSLIDVEGNVVDIATWQGREGFDN